MQYIIFHDTLWKFSLYMPSDNHSEVRFQSSDKAEFHWNQVLDTEMQCMQHEEKIQVFPARNFNTPGQTHIKLTEKALQRGIKQLLTSGYIATIGRIKTELRSWVNIWIGSLSNSDIYLAGISLPEILPPEADSILSQRVENVDPWEI